MMAVCPICGKLTVIHWPEHWVWKRGSSYYCGENCISIDITRDIKTLNEVQRRRRSALIMAKLKKDGTPAKKPGPKPKTIVKTEETTPELHDEVGQLRKDKEIAERVMETVRKEMPPLPVRAVGSRVREDCSYTVTEDGEMYLGNGGMWLQFSAEKWREFSNEIITALDQLGVNK